MRRIAVSLAVLLMSALFLLMTFQQAVPALVPGGTGLAGGFSIASIGRVEFNGKDYLCTGFIVRSAERIVQSRYHYASTARINFVVSAGHCRSDDMTFLSNPYQHSVGDTKFWMPRSSYKLTAVGHSTAPDGYDVMVAKFWSYFPFPVIEPRFGYKPKVGEKLTYIGYGGGVLQSYTARFLRHDPDGQLVLDRVGQTGFSGSPLLTSDGKAVGLAVGMKVEDWLACLLGVCKRLPEFYFEPIDAILGLVRW